jgi:CheY-like chemotaxis protein
MKTSKRRILIVDDEVDLSLVVKTGLEALGYEVRSENEPSRTLQVARSFKPDLIVLDVCMPGKDGGDVAQELSDQKDVADIPIVFLTSLLSKNDAARSKEQGETILAKPISIAELAQCIEECLGRK